MAESTENKVVSIIANIESTHRKDVTAVSNNIDDTDGNSTSKSKSVKKFPIRGKPKSGRFWKSNKEKFSSINKTKGLRQDFAKKTALRLELKRTKELSKQALEEFKQKEIMKKERRRENLKRAEENKRKSEVVQVITNSAKLKRMRKKQLRFIEKRDTNKEVLSNK